MRERVCITKLPFIQEGPVVVKVPIPIMISMEEGNNLNTTILHLNKEKEELEENFYKTTCERKQLDKDLNVALEQLKRSEERTRLEEEKKKQAYADLRVISSSLSANK